MKLIELKPELWSDEAIPTEYAAFQELRDNPLTTNTCYVAAPWSVIINRTLPAERRKRLNKLPSIQSGFTICQHISYEKLIPMLIKIGINTLFTPHVYKNHKELTVLPFPHNAVNGVNSMTKDLLYSFVGCVITHPTRRIIQQTIPDTKDVRFIGRNIWHFEGNNRALNVVEYKNILARSRFSLCPRGTGASTIRFWESLQAGAIPVLISDAMRLPGGWDWDNTIIRIKESKTKAFDRIIRGVSSIREEELRRNCIKAYTNFSGSNLVSNIRLLFEGNPKDLLTEGEHTVSE